MAQSFSRMIAGIRDQALAAERISTGDLTVEVAVKSENGLLSLKLREMVEKNNEVLTRIANASEQVAVGSKQVSDTSIALSQGATEQDSIIEELTASLEEIAAHSKLNANNANEANQLSENVRDNAVQGNTQMKEMLQAMEEINVASYLCLAGSCQLPLCPVQNYLTLRSIWFFGVVMNFVMTPLAAISTLTEPIVWLAHSTGLNPVSALYTWNQSSEQII